MSEIRIYGSQGQPLDSDTEPPDDRIKDFFFDGVRLAIQDRGHQVEATVFFRARESEASRSEQYYAVYQVDSVRDIGRGFHRDLAEIVEDRYGMELVTSTDDTNVFQMLVDNDRGRTPTNTQNLDDLKTLLGKRTTSGFGAESGASTLGLKEDASQPDDQPPSPVKIGVGSYQLAFGVLLEIITETDSVVIAENADSSRLADFGVVIEEGPYTGLTFLGETKSAIQSLRESRRQQRFGHTNTATDPGLFEKHQTTLFGVAGVVGVLLLVVAGLYGSAILGSPLVEGLPLMGGDDGGGETAEPTKMGFEYENGSFDYQNEQLQFNLTGDGDLPDSALVNVSIMAGPEETLWNGEDTVQGGNYTFGFNTSGTDIDIEGEHNLTTTVKWGNQSETVDKEFDFSTSNAIDDLDLSNVNYDGENNEVVFTVDSQRGEFPDNVNWTVKVRDESTGNWIVADIDLRYGPNTLGPSDRVPETLEAGNHTLYVNVTQDGELQRSLTADFSVEESETSQSRGTIWFADGPEYDPAERQVLFTLNSDADVPADAELFSNVTEISRGTEHNASRIGETMTVSAESLATKTYTLNVSLSSPRLDSNGSVNSTFDISTDPLSFEFDPAPAYDPTNQSVGYTIKAINESIPDRANVTVKLRQAGLDNTEQNTTVSFEDIRDQRQWLDSGQLETGEWNLEAAVYDQKFDADERREISFNVSEVYLGFSDGPAYNESTGNVTFDLRNQRDGEPLPSTANMTVRVENGSITVDEPQTINVTNGNYTTSFAPNVSDGEYDVVVTVDANNETYETRGSFVNPNISLGFSDGPEYDAVREDVAFELTNDAAGFTLPEETNLSVSVTNSTGTEVASDTVAVTNGSYETSINATLENGTHNVIVRMTDEGVTYETTESFVNRNVSLAFGDGPTFNESTETLSFNLTNTVEEFDLPDETTMDITINNSYNQTRFNTTLDITNGDYNRSIEPEVPHGNYELEVGITANGVDYETKGSFINRNVSLAFSDGPTYNESTGNLTLNVTNAADEFDLPAGTSMNVTVSDDTGYTESRVLNVTNRSFERSIPLNLSEGDYTVSVTIVSNGASAPTAAEITVGETDADQQTIARCFSERSFAKTT